MFASGIVVENSTNITFSDCSAGPCPACGGMGHIPDGVYNFIGNTIELLSGPARTVSELQRLANILREARKKNASLEEVKKEIQEEVPELSSLRDILPKNRSELYAFLALILSVITLLLPQLSSKGANKVEINNVINNVYQQAQPQETPKKGSPERKNKKIGRNEPCPCGSGKKYKKCCLLKT
jgi:uncharacterized protein YecA (UPF0149 family)